MSRSDHPNISTEGGPPSQGHVVAGLQAEVAASADLSLGGCDMPVILVTADELFLLL